MNDILEEQYKAVMSVRLSRLEQLPQGRTLENFLWQTQPERVRKLTLGYLKAWAGFVYKEMPRPAPVLHLWGGNNLGKSHVAIGVVRFFLMNFWPVARKDGLACSTQRVIWVDYCKSKLNGNDVEINPKADVLLLEDIDSFRPVPKSLSTYALEEAYSVLKKRVEDDVLPTVITGNWKPGDLEQFFARNSRGEETPSTRQSAKTLASALSRNTLAQVKFTGNNPYTDKRNLRKVALEENDMRDFLFLEGIGKETHF